MRSRPLKLLRVVVRYAYLPAAQEGKRRVTSASWDGRRCRVGCCRGRCRRPPPDGYELREHLARGQRLLVPDPVRHREGECPEALCKSAAAKSAAPLPLSRRRSPRPPRPPRPPQRPRRRRSPPLTPRRSRPARPPRRRRTVARNAGAPAATSLASALTRPRARASAGRLACGRARAASSSRRAMSNLQTAATAAAPIITAASRTSHPSGNSWGAQRFRAPPLMPRRRLRSSPHGRLRRSWRRSSSTLSRIAR